MTNQEQISNVMLVVYSSIKTKHTIIKGKNSLIYGNTKREFHKEGIHVVERVFYNKILTRVINHNLDYSKYKGK